MVFFETERLLVRKITLDDVEAMVAVYGDVESMRFVGDSRPLADEHCRYWVEVTDRNFEQRDYGMVAVVERSSGEVVGFCGVVHPGQQEEAEVKYAIRRDRWGLGYATEVIRGLVDYARAAWGRDRLIATVYVDHVRSQNVLAKVGFTFVEERANEDGSRMQVWESTRPS